MLLLSIQNYDDMILYNSSIYYIIIQTNGHKIKNYVRNLDNLVSK